MLLTISKSIGEFLIFCAVLVTVCLVPAYIVFAPWAVIYIVSHPVFIAIVLVVGGAIGLKVIENKRQKQLREMEMRNHHITMETMEIGLR